MAADNSPLTAKYPGLTTDYSTVNGSGRITFAEAVREEPTEATTAPATTAAATTAEPTEAPAADDGTNAGPIIAVVLAVLIVGVVVVVVIRKKKQ